MKNDAEITAFEKTGGPLTKRISLAPDGSVKIDGNACVMACGEAWRLRIADIDEFATVIEKTKPNQAFAPGTLRADLPERVPVVTKKNLNGQPNTIARTGAFVNYRKQQPGPTLVDYDAKGMPAEIAEEIKRRGGFWPTLVSIVPQLGSAAHLIRNSTSTGLFRTDTGQRLPGSNGLHVYLWVRDGADSERFLRTMHARCWNAGFGWMMVGAGGQLLERSIIDRMVGAPEHLMFEGGPILVPPVGQDRKSRLPMTVDGPPLDTIAACPPLTTVENAKLRHFKEKWRQRLAPETAKVRAEFVAEQAKHLAQRARISVQAAAEQVTRQCDGLLLVDVELLFDDEEFAGCTVGDVLNDPGRFEGATLADPLEGIDYGRCVARVMRRDDGTPWIHSFAHGRTIYELKYNYASVRSAMATAIDGDVVKTFVKLAASAELNAEELEKLRKEASERSGSGIRSISQMLRAAEREQTARHREEERRRHLAERSDPRPMLEVPVEDAPWIPQMDTLNDVIGDSTAVHPTLRSIDSDAAFTSQIAVPKTHAFTAASANPDEENT